MEKVTFEKRMELVYEVLKERGKKYIQQRWKYKK